MQQQIRLLHVSDFRFQLFPDDSAPPYVTASHRWLPTEDETTFEDVRLRRNEHKPGYQKVLDFCATVRWFNTFFKTNSNPPIEWVWIDTCCIDKKDKTELARSLASMCKWYERAALCFAYLADVPPLCAFGPDETWARFRQSEWFTRGWTLQELLAPKTVIFFDSDWDPIGRKDQHFEPCCEKCLPTRPCPKLVRAAPFAYWNIERLNDTIEQITTLPKDVLADFERRRKYRIPDLLEWCKPRRTTIANDRWYCMLGILDIYFPLEEDQSSEVILSRIWDELDRKTSVWASKPRVIVPSKATRGEYCIPAAAVSELTILKRGQPHRVVDWDMVRAVADSFTRRPTAVRRDMYDEVGFEDDSDSMNETHGAKSDSEDTSD